MIIEFVLMITADLVVEVMRCVESLLTYFGRAQDVEAKVCDTFEFFIFNLLCEQQHFEHCIILNKVRHLYI